MFFSGAYLAGESINITYHVLDQSKISNADWLTINQIPQNISFFPGYAWPLTDDNHGNSGNITITLPRVSNLASDWTTLNICVLLHTDLRPSIDTEWKCRPTV